VHLGRFSACTLLTCMWTFWVPGEESWGRSKTGEESQEGQKNFNPSLNVLVQSAKSGCKWTVKIIYPFLNGGILDAHVSGQAILV